MEWIDGIPLTDLAAIEASGLDRKALALNVIRSFLKHAIRDGFFHADMHQGNLFADPRDGALIAVDFGIMGRIGHKERRFLAEILYGFIVKDYRRIAEVHFEAGYVPANQDVAAFAQALRAIGEPIMGRPAAEISMARLLTQLFEVTDLFQMRMRPELLLLQKTMVVVEGVAPLARSEHQYVDRGGARRARLDRGAIGACGANARRGCGRGRPCRRDPAGAAADREDRADCAKR